MRSSTPQLVFGMGHMARCPAKSTNLLVLVPMVVVGGVAVSIVDVVDVIAVGDCLVATIRSVLVVAVIVVGYVFSWHALVPVAVVLAVCVSVVDVVDVVAVGDCLVAAVWSVLVVVLNVLCAGEAHVGFLLSERDRARRSRCG